MDFKQAERALEHFFSPANLTALREMALRRTAERVDAQMEDMRVLEGVRRDTAAVADAEEAWRVALPGALGEAVTA